MDSFMFEKRLIQSLRGAFHFHEDQVTGIELLKKVRTNTVSAQVLNNWVETGDLSAINDFEHEDITTTNDENCIGYYLVHFSSVKIIVSVLETDINTQNPHVMKYKLLQ